MLIVASLATDLVLLSWLVERRTQWPDLLVASALGLAAGQINLATLWGILGYRHLPWRAAVLIVVPLAWAFAMAASAPDMLTDYDYDRVATWGVHFLAQSSVLTSILILVRLGGAVLVSESLDFSDKPIRRQFALRYLFAWLTASAFVLSALKTTFDHANLAVNAFDWSGILILGFVNSTVGLSPLWLILDTRSRPRRLAATWVTAMPVVLITVATLLVFDRNRLLAVFLMWIVAGLYSAMAWHVLSVAGFRLTWLNAKRAEALPPPSS